MSDFRKNLTTCAYCPNTCRPSYASYLPVQIESQTPSALALIMLAVLDGYLPFDDPTRVALGRRDALDASIGHCTYGLDMATTINTAMLEVTSHD